MDQETITVISPFCKARSCPTRIKILELIRVQDFERLKRAGAILEALSPEAISSLDEMMPTLQVTLVSHRIRRDGGRPTDHTESIEEVNTRLHAQESSHAGSVAPSNGQTAGGNTTSIVEPTIYSRSVDERGDSSSNFHDLEDWYVSFTFDLLIVNSRLDTSLGLGLELQTNPEDETSD